MLKKILGFVAILGLSLSVWAAPVNVNTASAEALAENLSGVGETIAERIVTERDANGAFKDSDDLQARVNGIGPATIERNEADLQF